MDATQPQTDRELLLKLNGEIENLSKSIINFSNTLRDIEEKKIAILERRLDEFEKWRSQISGGWKVLVIIWIIVTAIGFGAIIKFVSR